MRRSRALAGMFGLAAVVGWLASVATGQYPAPAGQQAGRPAPATGQALVPAAAAQAPVRVAALPAKLPKLGQQLPNEHPLGPSVRWAKEGIPIIESIQDYSATLAKRERVGGKLGEYEYMFLKVRHRPFSVYMYFLTPANIKGQEVIFVEGRNNGNMWAHTVGMKDKLVGTVSLKPDGLIAMQGQRYPLTEIGLLNLVRRLAEVGEQDLRYGECEVKVFEGAKINDRICTCIQVVHPVPRRNFLFHLARIFVDQETSLPVRYESHDWPKTPGGAPELLEEYTYLDLKLNNGFTDSDFDIRNPSYRFR